MRIPAFAFSDVLAPLAFLGPDGVVFRPGNRYISRAVKAAANHAGVLCEKYSSSAICWGYRWKTTVSAYVSGALAVQERQQTFHREVWQKAPAIEKLVALLHEAFNSNLRAHAAPYLAREKYYAKKTRFLSMAAQYSHVIAPLFSGLTWGQKSDTSGHSWPIILYFQLGGAQVSFHSSEAHDAPEYLGEWVGYYQGSFPISEALVQAALLEFPVIETLEPCPSRTRKDMIAYIEEELPRVFPDAPSVQAKVFAETCLDKWIGGEK